MLNASLYERGNANGHRPVDAFIVFTLDGMDTVEESSGDAATQAKDLRAMDCPCSIVQVPWYKQDSAIDLINELTDQQKSLSTIKRMVSEQFCKKRGG